ncbi:hypothetical protein ACFWMS_09350 [Peribacillus butanolivorans]|uniref:hypothetical protein n=1 Tax=Peribacillus butanolivorans TaxID=421767 RepID=UPI003655A6AC
MYRFKREYIIHEVFLHEGGQAAAKRLLSINEPPTALVVSVWYLAMYHLFGVRTPEEISIVSFNHVLFSLPAFSSIDINIFDLVYQVAKSIQKLQTGDTSPESIIAHHFVERLSCKSIKQD